MELRVAFLNCKRMFAVGQAEDAPANDATLQAKIHGLAAGLKHLFLPELPDMIGLCEVGSKELAHDVLEAVHVGKYSPVWQEPPATGQHRKPNTGLFLGYDRDSVAVEETAPPELTPGEDHRHHWLAVRVRLQKTGPACKTFWIVVNHWPSDFRSGATRGMWPRALASKVLAEFLEHEAMNTSPAVLLIGDFNCEPFDPPLTGELLSGDRIVAVRERHRVLNERTRLPYFYNPMWRLMGEALPFEDVGAEESPRPPGTWADQPQPALSVVWRCFDQILVNRRLMKDGPADIMEKSIVVSRTDPGASDHCAIGVRLRYV